ncbi:hypothetical protein SAMN05660733_06809 [Lentzea albidocapillata]|uniref:Uncharacterized protein n=1 Tax=Lentzea albidocapillata TaxID=40571 RepID=A0A1W2FLE0_9PSEU|nr:hypothetical protein SAMN05660733_06809 [Lentzea albidocapillata]
MSGAGSPPCTRPGATRSHRPEGRVRANGDLARTRPHDSPHGTAVATRPGHRTTKTWQTTLPSHRNGVARRPSARIGRRRSRATLPPNAMAEPRRPSARIGQRRSRAAPSANGNGGAEACEPLRAGQAVVTHALGDWGFTLSGRDAPLMGTAGRFSARPFPAVKHPARGSRSSPNRYRRAAAMTGTGPVLPARPPTQGDLSALVTTPLERDTPTQTDPHSPNPPAHARRPPARQTATPTPTPPNPSSVLPTLPVR